MDEARKSRRLNGAEFNTYALGESVEEAAANLVTRPSDNAVVPSPDTLVGTRVSHTTEDGVQGHSFTNSFLYGGIYLIKEMEPPLGDEISAEGKNGILAVPDDMEEAELQKLQTLFGAHPPKLLKYGDSDTLHFSGQA